MGLEQACGAAGAGRRGGGSGVGVWTQISVGRFGCWVIRSQHSRCLPYVSLNPVSWGNLPRLEVRGFRVGLGDAQVRI